MGLGFRNKLVRVNRAFALLALALSCGCAKAHPVATKPLPSDAAIRQLRADITAILDRPGHRHGTWGVVVQSLSEADRLFELNPRTLLVPGSTLKLVTAATAGAAVGWDYTFETRVQTAGVIRDGHLQGDLVLVGTGDPSLLGRGGNDFIGALDRKSTRLNSSHVSESRMPSSA